MEIALVDEGDVHGRAAQCARRVEPAEPPAENENAMRNAFQDSGAMADSSVNSRTNGRAQPPSGAKDQVARYPRIGCSYARGALWAWLGGNAACVPRLAPIIFHPSGVENRRGSRGS